MYILISGKSKNILELSTGKLYDFSFITAMRRIWIQVQTRLTTKYEIDVKICILFLIKLP